MLKNNSNVLEGRGFATYDFDFQDSVTMGTICNNIELKIPLFHNVSSIMTSC